MSTETVTTHKCAAAHCMEGISPSRFFCSIHWPLVPWSVQQGLFSLWNKDQEPKEQTEGFNILLMTAVHEVAKQEGVTGT